MNIYNGVYRWDGKRHGNREPIAWFPGSYYLQIVNLQDNGPGVNGPGVTFLKPYLCIYSETGQGHSISANPERFAKQICTDFSLELERVLWIEKNPRQVGRYEVIVFTRSNRLGENLFYTLSKRPPTAAEAVLIDKVQDDSRY